MPSADRGINPEPQPLDSHLATSRSQTTPHQRSELNLTPFTILHIDRRTGDWQAGEELVLPGPLPSI
jgi:hypothetical protein